MKAIIPATTMALIANVTAQNTPCLPIAKRIQVLQTQHQPLGMFELQAFGNSEQINLAANPDAIVSQSTTGKDFVATNAIDGDLSTFSNTRNSTDSEWWKIEFGAGQIINEVRITNRWCKDESDPRGCRCHLSNAKVWLFGENGKWLAGHKLGDTCDMDEIVMNFEPQEKYCKTSEELATDVAESPSDKIEAGVCQDDVGFVTAEGHTCEDIAAMTASSQILLCKRVGNEDYADENGNFYLTSHFCSVTCGDCVPDASSGADLSAVVDAGAEGDADSEPTYSPTYLPSAQPVATIKGWEWESFIDQPINSPGSQCLPVAKRIEVKQTEQQPLSMFEFQAFGNSEQINLAANPDVTVTQSSTMKQFDATNAIDGDLSTFSHTKFSTGSDSAWWKIEFGTGQIINEVRITNRWCKDESDPRGCRCHLSNAKVWLFGENGKWLAGHKLGDTCDMDEIVMNFEPQEKYCKTSEELATDVAESPSDKIEAGVCQDDVGFVTAEGHTCEDIAAMTASSQILLCKRVGNEDYADENGNFYLTSHFCSVTCGDCVPDASSGADLSAVVDAGAEGDADSEPTYSPTYLPSAQPVATANKGWESVLENFHKPNDAPASAPDKDTPNSPTPDEDTESINSPASGHAYSAGDVCKDDQTFVSNKGITCKSFVFAETVHCHTATGMHDSDFNPLHYSDFCPETCGVYAEVAASMATAEAGGNSKAVGLGVGLFFGFVIVVFFTWLYCNSGKFEGMKSRHVVSEFRDDPTLSSNRGEYRDDDGVVGLKKKTSPVIEVPNMEGLFPDIGNEEEVVPKAQIV